MIYLNAEYFMDNVFNFRDLGGIPTTDGRKVKSGLFFRSGLLDFANDNDIAFLRKLGLLETMDTKICCLR